MSEPTVTLTIDGRQATVARGTNLIEAARRIGILIPHYCYHPKLSIAGNCRMCLVEVGTPKIGPDKKPQLGPDGKPVIVFMPALQIACNTQATDGMVVLTRSPAAVKARQGVMEFLLINHPLDCPICDQAGECRLQAFAVDHGQGASRFAEHKVHKPKQVSLSPEITLDVERCIMCSRCERFMREIAGQDCLGFIKRGSHVELACYPGQFPDTNYDLNIVDLCPVGALTSTDFRFQQRVWFLKETRSICPHCATGCNTVVWSREGVVYRQTPRDNPAVNECWMCDYGRLHYRFVNAPQRLLSPSFRDRPTGTSSELGWSEAIGQACAAVLALRQRGGALAALASARATNEELYLFARLAREALGASLLDCAPRQEQGDGFLLDADRNPNANGARLTGAASRPLGSAVPAIAEGIRSGQIHGLVVLGANPVRCGLTEGLLAGLDLLLVIDALPNPATGLADFLLPGATWAEKRGSFVNGKGRLQRFDMAIPPRGEALPDWQILASLLHALRPETRFASLEEVFSQAAAAIPALAGLTLGRIGDQGIQLDPSLIPAG